MKENNKYYTPDISEFHVGFEYEKWNDVSQNFDKIVAKSPAYIQNASVLLKEVAMKGVGWKIRVKYLDEEDLEELGWKKAPLSQVDFKLGKWEMFFSDYNGRKVTIYHDGEKSEGRVGLKVKNLTIKN